MKTTDRKPLFTSIGPYMLTGLLILAGVVLLVGFFSLPNSGKEAGAVVALAGSVAIGIERAMELFWLFIDFNPGPGWPFLFLTKPIKDLQAQLDTGLGSYLEGSKKALATVRDKFTDDELKKLEQDIETANTWVEDLRKALPEGGRYKELLPVVSTRLKGIQDTIKSKGGDIVDISQDSIKILENILKGVEDNPGRRVFSLFAGTILGMIVCALFGVDILQSILGVKYEPFQLGVVSTGILVGLGADPTHQVIRLLEESKQRAKGDNAAAAKVASESR